MIFIGTGFSVPAGLPVAGELLTEVRNDIMSAYGENNKLEQSLDYYIEFENKCNGGKNAQNDVNIEKFISFLDIEHFLELRGSDHFSGEGNVPQIMIRKSIGKTLHRRTPKQLPSVYIEFAKNLRPNDCIVSFNYDTLLELAMDQAKVPYRLFPHRFSSIHPSHSVIDSSRREVIILKMHGSIDWVDRSGYEDALTYAKSLAIPGYTPKNAVFGPDSVIETTPLVDGPRPQTDPLSKIFRAVNPEKLFERRYFELVPMILSPSYNKLLYSKPLTSFWRAISGSGVSNFGLGVIGYSLPEYDDYAKQAIYEIASTYQKSNKKWDFSNLEKTPIRFIDFRPTVKGVNQLKKNYRFLDWSRTELWKMGLTTDAIRWLLKTSEGSRSIGED